MSGRLIASMGFALANDSIRDTVTLPILVADAHVHTMTARWSLTPRPNPRKPAQCTIKPKPAECCR